MQYIKNIKKYQKIESICLIILFIVISIALNSKSIFAQTPSPYNIEGHVYHSDEVTGAGNYIVRINDTISGDLVFTYSLATPPFPPFLGSYSATISGNDNDLVIVTSWNSSDWGTANTTLLSTTTTIDVVLNRSRASEPNVTIIIPDNNSIRNTSYTFNVTANITMLGNDGTNCNATIFFSNNAANITADQNFTNQLGDISFENYKSTTWNVSGIKEGILNITVSARCGSDGIKLENLDSFSINLSISDTTRPIVNSISPENNTWLNSNITFEYNVTESTGIKNCSLYFNEKLNQTSNNLEADTLLNFTLNNTLEGHHNWSISCFDNSSNFNQGNSSILRINVDDTSPNVTLLSPINFTLLTQNNILFEYNVTDKFNATNCSLILNNEVIQTNYTITLNISNNFSRTLFGGDYNWTVNCSDNANNIGGSNQIFRLISSDLKVNSSDIVFSNNNLVEKEQIVINATIFNLGIGNATNVTIQFFENDPNLNGVQIGTNQTINISGLNNASVNVDYTLRIGKVDIFVIVDPPLLTNGSIIEISESNNKANRSINIPSYHTFYGDIVSDIFLDTSVNLTVIAWTNSTNFAGNIFVADSDSTIDFSNLQALSINITNNLTMDDFVELDNSLNMTNLTDSINRTYTADGAVKNIENFNIFGTNIKNVSVVNSTNTSDFITGIFWDTSDYTEIGFYNGSQDIVFVTKINMGSNGLYGNYDYEIKIPSNLREYLNPNVQDSISFYREIT